MDIQLTEEFNSQIGQFVNYNAYEEDERVAINSLKHIDMRVMEHNDVSVPLTVLGLSLYTMGYLDTLTMDELSGTIIILPEENWDGTPDTSGTYLRHDPITKSVTGSTTATLSSTMVDFPVDISQLESDDFISISLPNFPHASLDLDESGVYFTDGDGITNTVYFDSGINSPVTNFEHKFLISELDTIDLSNIVTVGFTLKATSNCTVVVMAVRALSKEWQYMPVDMDTRYGRLVKTVPPNGNFATAYAFTQPTLWRSTSSSGDNDPRPINANFAVRLNSGAEITGKENSIKIFFRELTKDFLTQLDIDGLQQGELNGHDQPDVGEAMYISRIQTELEEYEQDELDEEEQYDLERSPDYLSASWIEFELKWNDTDTTVAIQDSELNGYSFTTALDPNAEYIWFVSVEENTVRSAIHEMDYVNQVGAKVFDTYEIPDDTAFKRRGGRFGWYADLQTGNAYVKSIQERSTTYAEYRSSPFESVTPVSGAQLFATTSPNVEKFEFLIPGPFNSDILSTVSRDSVKTNGGDRSWKIDTYGSSAYQGVMSNLLLLTDFKNSEIQFDIFYPASAVNAGIQPRATLIDETGVGFKSLLMPFVFPDQWQRVRILMPFDDQVLSGQYKLFIYQPVGYGTTTWWLDNVSVFTRSVAWDARANVGDPWYDYDRWVPFRNVINQNDGILFPERGNRLQVRAKGLTQSSTINRIQIKPQYAELGRIVE